MNKVIKILSVGTLVLGFAFLATPTKSEALTVSFGNLGTYGTGYANTGYGSYGTGYGANTSYYGGTGYYPYSNYNYGYGYPNGSYNSDYRYAVTGGPSNMYGYGMYNNMLVNSSGMYNNYNPYNYGYGYDYGYGYGANTGMNRPRVW